MNENLKELIDKTQNVINKNWIKSSYNGYGGCGGTFEKEIGIPTNNFQIADYNGIEIKTKISNKENHITLFCSTPDSYLFEINRIYNQYGYKTKSSEKSFNISVYSNKYVYLRDNYYKLNVDRKKKIVSLCIYNKNMKLIDNNASWSFDLLEEKVNRKVKNLFIVFGERKYENKNIFYKYNKYHYFVLQDFSKFIDALEKGFVRISFSIGTYKTGIKKGQIYDHGTSFNIALSNLEKIYTKEI